MNEFIRIINNIIEEKLDGKIALVSVMFYVKYEVMGVSVKYYNNEDLTKLMGFDYKYYPVRHEPEWMMEEDFKSFIKDAFNL